MNKLVIVLFAFILPNALFADELYYDSAKTLHFVGEDYHLSISAGRVARIGNRLEVSCNRGNISRRSSDGDKISCHDGEIIIKDYYGNKLIKHSVGAIIAKNSYGESFVVSDKRRSVVSRDAVSANRSSSNPGVSIGAGGIQARGSSGSTVRIGPGGIHVEKSTPTGGRKEVRIGGDSFISVSKGAAESHDPNWRSRKSVRIGNVTSEEVMRDLAVVEKNDELQVNFDSDIFFEFDSDRVQPIAANTLAKLALLIREKAIGNVKIYGHTDSVGSHSYNQKLSERRALAVLMWLRDYEGIPSSIMFVRGLGEDYPIADNTYPGGVDNPRGRAKNRRVEIRIGLTEDPFGTPTHQQPSERSRPARGNNFSFDGSWGALWKVSRDNCMLEQFVGLDTAGTVALYLQTRGQNVTASFSGECKPYRGEHDGVSLVASRSDRINCPLGGSTTVRSTITFDKYGEGRLVRTARCGELSCTLEYTGLAKKMNRQITGCGNVH